MTEVLHGGLHRTTGSLIAEVVRVLSDRADSVAVSAALPAYRLLHDLHVTRGNYRAAAHVMLCCGRRLRLQAEGAKQWPSQLETSMSES